MIANRVKASQKLWGWEVAAHLFLVGTVAGVYIIGSIFGILNPEGFTLTAKLAVVFAAPLLLIGCIFMLSHLGNSVNWKKAFSNPMSSWLARGAIALLAFLVLDLIQIFLWIWPLSVLEGLPGLNIAWQVTTSIVALYVLIYTGMLLANLKSFPFWNSWRILLLYVVSGLTGGLLFLILLTATFADSKVIKSLMVMIFWNDFFIVATALTLLLLLWRRGPSSAVKDGLYSITRLHSVSFYVGVVVAGILIPLFLGLFLSFSSLTAIAVTQTISIIFALSGLIGGYIFKNLVLKAGVSERIDVQGEMVPLPDIARVPSSQRVNYGN